MEFHEELKAARIKTGLTQQQIADILGVTKSTYCGYETAKRSPDPQRIKQLAKILHVSADTLLDTSFGKQKEKAPTPAEAEAGELQTQEVIDAFVQAGFIQRGRDLTDADLRFLRLVGDMVSGWFDGEQNSV